MINRKLILTICAAASLVLLGRLWVQFGWAAEGPDRKVEIIVPFTETVWWLTSWSDNSIVCTVPVDHDGLPTLNEVYFACGETIYDEWRETPLCNASEEGAPTETCEGLYLFQAAKRPQEKTFVVNLPEPSVWLTLDGCTLVPPENRCDEIPELVLTGEEPLPNERIIGLHLRIGDEELTCESDQCAFPMPITLVPGVEIEFWADSSFGDSSEIFTGQIRVVDGGVSDDPLQNTWFVDVLSAQWRGSTLASCSQSWEAFPPVGGPPIWLSSPEHLDALETDEPYIFLAGRLIAQGVVDGSSCPAGGLLENGNANNCGVEISREAVNEWQDRFDAKIISVSQKTNVPGQLMKKLFAVESQFWPGSLIPQEFGLGQMTEQGADAALLWNPDFFDEFCPLVLEESACSGGYLHLKEKNRLLLRGALAARTDATCPDCQLGIDLENTDFSIEVFANTLLGNCEQTGRIVRNTTEKAPGAHVSYEDLWRFTLVNYNAGPGCLSSAAKKTWQTNRALDWEKLSARLTGVCQGAIAYVDKIAGQPSPEEEPSPVPTETIEITPSPTASPPPYPPPYPAPAPYP